MEIETKYRNLLKGEGPERGLENSRCMVLKKGSIINSIHVNCDQ